METITLSREDRAQVRAILETHAELQDRGALESTQIMSRLKVEEANDADAQEMVGHLTEQVSVLEGDSDNLRRLADLFN